MFQAQATPYGQYIPYGFDLANHHHHNNNDGYTANAFGLDSFVGGDGSNRQHQQHQHLQSTRAPGTASDVAALTAAADGGPASGYHGIHGSASPTDNSSSSPGNNSSSSTYSSSARRHHPHFHLLAHLYNTNTSTNTNPNPDPNNTAAGDDSDNNNNHNNHNILHNASQYSPLLAAWHHILRLKMDPGMSDIAQQEAAARDYTPQREGPLVGDKRSSQAITEEYARADPTFIAKTMALPQTYSHYRPIQGDGNCGWRAIAFAYFETLLRSCDLTFIQREKTRMQALNGYMETVGGQDPTIFEFMIEPTFDIFDQVTRDLSSGVNDSMPFVLSKFNDPHLSACLVYHLRLLAVSKIRENAPQYEPYLDGNVDRYVTETLLRVDEEIDHMAIVLLHDVLLQPAGIVLEIAYLDRSEGSQVNVHRFPDEANGQDPATLGHMIHLLYRPSHYDILYRDLAMPVPLPVASPPVNVEVHRATFLPSQFQETMPGPFTSFDMLSMIPQASPGLFDTGLPSPMTDPYAASPGSPWAPPFDTESISAPPPSHPSPPQQQQHPLRFSKYNFPQLTNNTAAAETTNGTTTSTMYDQGFSTNTFKNSHFNTAHYNNSNFQPEMYNPGADDSEVLLTGNAGKMGSGSRKRSTDHCSVVKKER